MASPRLAIFAAAFAALLAFTGTVGSKPPGHQPPGQSAPTNTAPPVINGTAQVGQTLTGSPGTWSGSQIAYGYWWQRCDSAGANCSDITGATTSSYQAVSADVGYTLRLKVTASNQWGTASAVSAPTAAVTVGTAASDTTAPTVTLTSPADNPPGGYTYLTGTVTVSANGSDNVGVASVSFYFGSTLIATDTAAPYSASLDTSKWPDGQTSTLKAVAKDAAGNQAGDSIYVKVGSSTSSTATISPSSLAGATVGVAYSQQLSASGPKPPYSFKLSLGSLPSGLSLSSAGLLSGTPSASGSFAFTVAALDSGGASATSKAYTLAVATAPTTPSSSWPASYRSGPTGAANILPPHQGVLSGFSPGGPGCNWSCMQSRVLQRETQLGRHLDLLGLFGIAPSGGCWYSDSAPFALGHESWAASRGSYPYISWTPGFTLDQILAGKADSCWQTFGQRAKAYAKPVFLRPFWEFNIPGATVWYGTGDKHIAAWRRMVDIVKAQGVSNVAFVWCPSDSYYGSTGLQSYPGDAYVDWVCTDGYSRDQQWCSSEVQPTYYGWCEFRDIFHDSYSVARDFQNRKPFMVGETGVRDSTNTGKRGQWWTNAQSAIKSGFPNLLAVAPLDQDLSSLEPNNNWLLDSGDGSGLTGFRSMVLDPYFNTRGQ